MVRALRIALVVDPFRLTRGGEGHPASIARELLDRGHTVCGFGAPPEGRPGAAGGGAEEQWGTRRGLIDFRPDVVVAYDTRSPAAWRGAQAARRLEVPLVLVEQGVPPRIPRFARFLRWLGQSLWGRAVARQAARVVALDAVARDQLVERGYRGDEIEVVPPGVDLTRYRPGLTTHLLGRHGVRGRVLLYVGRLDAGTRVGLVIRAFAAGAGRTGHWALVIAGDGPERRRLRTLADRLGVGAQVHWCATPPRAELPGLFGAATLLLVPETGDDVAGWRVRRALASGLPVMACDTPRYEALVGSDEAGLLAPEGDLEAWIDALGIAVGSPERRRRWGVRARELARTRYAWGDVTSRFEAVLLDACARSEVDLAKAMGVESSSP